MKNTQTYETRSKKECRECGCEIKERRESIIYECERCIGNTEEQNKVEERMTRCGLSFFYGEIVYRDGHTDGCLADLLISWANGENKKAMQKLLHHLFEDS